MERYRDFHLAVEEEFVEAEEEDGLLFEFGEGEIRALPQETVEPE